MTFRVTIGTVAGALSLLYPAVSPDALGGQLYEPDQEGYRGYPTVSMIKENALGSSHRH